MVLSPCDLYYVVTIYALPVFPLTKTWNLQSTRIHSILTTLYSYIFLCFWNNFSFLNTFEILKLSSHTNGLDCLCYSIIRKILTKLFLITHNFSLDTSCSDLLFDCECKYVIYRYHTKTTEFHFWVVMLHGMSQKLPVPSHLFIDQAPLTSCWTNLSLKKGSSSPSWNVRFRWIQYFFTFEEYLETFS